MSMLTQYFKDHPEVEQEANKLITELKASNPDLNFKYQYGRIYYSYSHLPDKWFEGFSWAIYGKWVNHN